MDASKQTLDKYIAFARKFMELPSDIIVDVLPYSSGKFGNKLVASVVNGHRISFNQSWLDSGRDDSEDVAFFTFHELRHMYQREQAFRLSRGGSIDETPDVIRAWWFEHDHYITNYGDQKSRLANLHQEIEQDANGYAFALCRLMHPYNLNKFILVRLEQDAYDMAERKANEYIGSRAELKKYLSEITQGWKVDRKGVRQYDPYKPCPCGSGKKFKFCCKGKGIYD